MSKPASVPTDPVPVEDKDGNADKPARKHTDPHDQEHARKVAEEKAPKREKEAPEQDQSSKDKNNSKQDDDQPARGEPVAGTGRKADSHHGSGDNKAGGSGHGAK